MRSISRLLLVLFAAFFISKTATAQTDKFSEDQKVLLKEALRTALVTEKNLPNYGDLKDKKEIVLLNHMVSFDNPDSLIVFLTPEVLPTFEQVKLKLQTEAEIKGTKQKNDLLFVRVARIDQPGSDYGIVHVFGQWDLGEKSIKKGYQFKEAYGYTMLFKKENGTWKYQKAINHFPNLIDQKQ